jgi:GntR family transcriptional repressor for pyruvate dehydrogenase complex
MFKQIKVRRVPEEIFEQIKTAIETGQLKPGEKLPTEKEFVNTLGVSRVPIREALQLLARAGYIETVQGHGSFVRSVLTDQLQDPLKRLVKDNVEKMFELLEVRKEIEAWTAYYAALEATDADLANLHNLAEEMKKQFEKTGRISPNLDINFHMGIAQSSSNTIRAHLFYTIIHSVFSDYFRLTIDTLSQNRDFLQLICDQHIQLYEAISRHDAEGARDAVSQHLASVAAALRKQMHLDNNAGK